jgi:hypothetical protein
MTRAAVALLLLAVVTAPLGTAEVLADAVWYVAIVLVVLLLVGQVAL